MAGRLSEMVLLPAYVESRGIVTMTIRFVQACGGGVMPIGRQIMGPANIKFAAFDSPAT